MPVVAVCGDGQGVSTGLPALREGGQDTQGARGEGSRSCLPRAVPLPTTAIPGADGWLLARDSPQDPLGGALESSVSRLLLPHHAGHCVRFVVAWPKGFPSWSQRATGRESPSPSIWKPRWGHRLQSFPFPQFPGTGSGEPPSPFSCLDYFPHQKLYSPVSFSKPGPCSVTVEGTGIKLHSFSRWHSCGVGCLTAPPVSFSSSQGLSRDKVQNCRRVEHRNR